MPDPNLWPCEFDGATRIVAPLSELLGFSRKHRLPDLTDVLVDMLAVVRDRELPAAVCPRCFAVTTNRYYAA